MCDGLVHPLKGRGAILKLGVIGSVGVEEDRRETLSRLTRAEAQGYEAVWVSGTAPNGGAAGRSLFAAAHLAEQTQQVRIGLSAPLDSGLHPLRLAEDLAVLDIVSNGRLDWAPTGPDLSETLEIVTTAWKGKRFSHSGPHFEFPELVCLPVPEQRPHPPIWLDWGSAQVPIDVDPRSWGWVIDPLLSEAFQADLFRRVLIYRIQASDDQGRWSDDVSRLKERYAPDLVLAWPGAENDSESVAGRLQDKFAEVCLGVLR